MFFFLKFYIVDYKSKLILLCFIWNVGIELPIENDEFVSIIYLTFLCFRIFVFKE